MDDSMYARKSIVTRETQAVRRSQPDVREEQAGPFWVTERFVVATKPLITVERRDLSFKGSVYRSNSDGCGKSVRD
jgi:hypothetical protein